MAKQELENLVKIGQLKREPPTRAEFDGMINGAKKRASVQSLGISNPSPPGPDFDPQFLKERT